LTLTVLVVGVVGLGAALMSVLRVLVELVLVELEGDAEPPLDVVIVKTSRNR
jgi:hypothetical protein